jgi:hypothetical protein
MRVLHEVVIVGMALAFVSATSAFAGGKGGGGPTHSEITVTKPVDVATPKVSGSKTKGDKVQYLKYNFGTVFTTLVAAPDQQSRRFRLLGDANRSSDLRDGSRRISPSCRRLLTR